MAILLKILLLIFLYLFSFAKEGVQTYGEEKNGELQIYMINNNPYDITFKYLATYDKLVPVQSLPITDSIKSKGTKLIAKYMIFDEQYMLTNNYSWVLGNKYAIHDDKYLYKLPYKDGATYQVTQGFNGSFSHNGDSQYAVDFGMEEGAEIHASRGGVVVDIKNNGFRNGANKIFATDANHITIKHDDGTYGKYVHLKFGGVMVKVGDAVKRGDFLGYSGNTGWTNGPHLHFVVFTGKDHASRKSIPIKFISSDGIVDEPIRGVKYTSVE